MLKCKWVTLAQCLVRPIFCSTFGALIFLCSAVNVNITILAYEVCYATNMMIQQ